MTIETDVTAQLLAALEELVPLIEDPNEPRRNTIPAIERWTHPTYSDDLRAKAERLDRLHVALIKARAAIRAAKGE